MTCAWIWTVWIASPVPTAATSKKTKPEDTYLAVKAAFEPAEGLTAAQLPIHRRFVVLAGQLWSQAKRLKQAEQTGPPWPTSPTAY